MSDNIVPEKFLAPVIGEIEENDAAAATRAETFQHKARQKKKKLERKRAPKHLVHYNREREITVPRTRSRGCCTEYPGSRVNHLVAKYKCLYGT